MCAGLSSDEERRWVERQRIEHVTRILRKAQAANEKREREARIIARLTAEATAEPPAVVIETTRELVEV